MAQPTAPQPAFAIRPVAACDEAEWRGLFAAYIAFYKAEISGDVIAATFAHLLDPGRDDMIGLVAVDLDGRLAGLAHIVFHPSTWAATGYCYLEDLFVAPSTRGRGIGRQLIEAVYTEADHRGAGRTYWATHASNAPARGLYDRMARLAPFVQYRR